MLINIVLILFATQPSSCNVESILKRLPSHYGSVLPAFTANVSVNLNSSGKIANDTGFLTSSPCGCEKIQKRTVDVESIMCGDSTWAKDENGEVQTFPSTDIYQRLTNDFHPVDLRSFLDTGAQLMLENDSLTINTQRIIDEKKTRIKMQFDTTNWLLREVTMYIGPADPFRIIYQYTTFHQQPVYKRITVIMSTMGIQTYTFSDYRRIRDPKRKFFVLK
jgi:hypothetical protein